MASRSGFALSASYLVQPPRICLDTESDAVWVEPWFGRLPPHHHVRRTLKYDQGLHLCNTSILLLTLELTAAMGGYDNLSDDDPRAPWVLMSETWLLRNRLASELCPRITGFTAVL